MRAAMTAATAARANRAAAATTLHQEEAEFDWPYWNRFFSKYAIDAPNPTPFSHGFAFPMPHYSSLSQRNEETF
jgi:hypothetical protein